MFILHVNNSLVKGEWGEVDSHQKLTALMDVINHGRVRYPDQFEICLPLFAAMATPQEISSRKSTKAAAICLHELITTSSTYH